MTQDILVNQHYARVSGHVISGSGLEAGVDSPLRELIHEPGMGLCDATLRAASLHDPTVSSASRF